MADEKELTRREFVAEVTTSLVKVAAIAPCLLAVARCAKTGASNSVSTDSNNLLTLSFSGFSESPAGQRLLRRQCGARERAVETGGRDPNEHLHCVGGIRRLHPPRLHHQRLQYDDRQLQLPVPRIGIWSNGRRGRADPQLPR